MTELLTAAQMRAIEQAAIASGEVTGLELMERAGQGVVEAIFEEWPELRATSHRAVVLCGPGNNGGDGFVVARLLKEWGWEVEVFLYGTPEKMPPDARVNYERWCEMGEVTARRIDPPPLVDDSLQIGDTVDLIVDAIFGTGLTRPFRGVFAMFSGKDVQTLLKNAGVKRVAIDVPTGLCADSGKVLGQTTIPADLTVSFHTPKPCHFLSVGAAMSGRVKVVDIGLKTKSHPSLAALARFHNLDESNRRLLIFGINRSLLRLEGHNDWAFRFDKSVDDNKYSHGHALIVSGDHGRAGAARLAARGALRIGAGVVTMASPPAAMAENAARLDAIMLREVAGAEDLAGVLADKRINALCLGPGMGTGEREAGLVAAALESRGEPGPKGDIGRGSLHLVLDADALTLLSKHLDLFAALHKDCILTPHAGEFARLFPDIAAKLNAPATTGPAYSKVDASREAAARAGCVVLFKGPDTVIADPSGRAAINAAVYDRAAPWLATAGSGDVLAGFITGLLARGFAPFDAACTGAWLHVECARSFGPGLIAEDLPEELPKVFRALGL